MVLNPRDIPECLMSIRALPIDKVWFRGFREDELTEPIRKFIESTNYDRYLIVSDDVIATPLSLENVLRYQEVAEVVTGWCNIFPDDTLVSLKLHPFGDDLRKPSRTRFLRDSVPDVLHPLIRSVIREGERVSWMTRKLYAHFPREEEIWAQKKLFRTYLLPWALTSMTRDLWLRYGFKPAEEDMRGAGSDLRASIELNKEGIVMLCSRDAFIFHLRTRRNFIIGKVSKEVIFERQVEQYDTDYIAS